MQALICSVGTEILLGNIVDTNSQYIASHLKDMGINVYKMVTVGDNFKRLEKVLKEDFYDYVFITGGLGPTEDDITKEVVMKVANKNKLLVDKDSLRALEEYFSKDDKAIDINKKQAIFPEDAIILKNPKGTAPGCIIESDKTKFVLLPGPPHEMTYMFDKEVAKHIMKDSFIKSVTVKTAFLGEWDMASRVDLSGENPTISPYATDNGCILRITASGKSEAEVDKLLARGINDVKESLGDYIITFEDKRKEEVLIDILRERKEFVATAESFTGGLIASSIIDIDGASDVIKESYVTYANSSKHDLLNVSYETIEKYDVVSKEVLKEMLDGLYKKTKGRTYYSHNRLCPSGESFCRSLV